MSHANVEVVRRVYEASARRDSKSVLALYDADVEWTVRDGKVTRAVWFPTRGEALKTAGL